MIRQPFKNTLMYWGWGMKKIFRGVAAALLSGTPVYAADVYQPPVEAPFVEQPVEVVEASGWYLRGDVGYAWNDLRGAHYFQGSNSNLVDFDRADVDDSYVLGGGVGYQINSYLRADVTLDYLGESGFNGSTSGGCGVAVNCVSNDVASMSAWSLLANAYVDLGTYGAFTPYVGAGIGGTRVKWGTLRNTSCDVTDPSNCDPTIEHKGESDWRFTYALMAGTSVDLTCNLKADVGYRFRHINGGNMFGYNLNSGPAYDKDIYVHEARAGLRYSFGNNCEAAYVPPAEPIVYK